MTEPFDATCAADLALVRAVLANEETAIRRFTGQLNCVPRILAAQNARFGQPLNRDDLADLAQDTVVVILQKLHEYAGRAPVEGWIYQVCRLEFMNTMRRKRRAHHQIENLESPDPGASAADAHLDRQMLTEALAKVGGAEAESIAMKHFEGLTFEEMSQRLDVAVSTLKTRYYKGMARLEEILRTHQQQEGGTGG